MHCDLFKQGVGLQLYSHIYLLDFFCHTLLSMTMKSNTTGISSLLDISGRKSLLMLNFPLLNLLGISLAISTKVRLSPGSYNFKLFSLWTLTPCKAKPAKKILEKILLLGNSFLYFFLLQFICCSISQRSLSLSGFLSLLEFPSNSFGEFFNLLLCSVACHSIIL